MDFFPRNSGDSWFEGVGPHVYQLVLSSSTLPSLDVRVGSVMVSFVKCSIGSSAVSSPERMISFRDSTASFLALWDVMVFFVGNLKRRVFIRVSASRSQLKGGEERPEEKVQALDAVGLG